MICESVFVYVHPSVGTGLNETPSLFENSSGTERIKSQSEPSGANDSVRVAASTCFAIPSEVLEAITFGIFPPPTPVFSFPLPPPDSIPPICMYASLFDAAASSHGYFARTAGT